MKEKDFKKQIFNYISANSIDNPFNNKLSMEEIKYFEKQKNLLLPNEYKFFLNQIGNGGFGPGQGILKLQESVVDFKLDSKPLINLFKPFRYIKEWNPIWIESFDWENEKPDLDIVNQYMDVSHISGTLQISHYGHGCTNLIVVNGLNFGEIWFDSRADYGGLIPEFNNIKRFCFFEWYINWLNRDL